METVAATAHEGLFEAGVQGDRISNPSGGTANGFAGLRAWRGCGGDDNNCGCAASQGRTLVLREPQSGGDHRIERFSA